MKHQTQKWIRNFGSDALAQKQGNHASSFVVDRLVLPRTHDNLAVDYGMLQKAHSAAAPYRLSAAGSVPVHHRPSER
jgi:hypothetical protein